MSTHENDSEREQAYWEGRYDADKEIATLRKEKAETLEVIKRALNRLPEDDLTKAETQIKRDLESVLSKLSLGEGK